MLVRNDQKHIVGSPTIRYCWRLLPNERGVPACLSYIVEGNRIRLPGNPAGVQFDFPMADVIETEETIAICLQIPNGRKCSENVYGIDREGNLRWRIKPKSLPTRDGPYAGMSFHGPTVRLYGADGRVCDVDLRNGLEMSGEQQ